MATKNRSALLAAYKTKESVGAPGIRRARATQAMRRKYVILERRRAAKLFEHDDSPKSRRQLDTPSPSPFAQYVNERAQALSSRRIESPSEGPSVASNVLLRLRRALNAVCQPDTVFPYIVADGDGGVAATWIAGDHAIEVSCGSKLDLQFLRQRGDDTLQFTFDPDVKDGRDVVRDEIDQLSKYVKTANPGWRNLFAR